MSFLSAYIECALWSSTDDAGNPLDRDFSEDDLSPETLAAMARDCDMFEKACADDLSDWDDEQAGHPARPVRSHQSGPSGAQATRCPRGLA